MLTAIIREDECIGCSRCIQACPVDAILGANKFTHTILTDECIGCKLCLNPCPVDCIDIVPLEDKLPDNTTINKSERAQKAKTRHLNRNKRLQKEAQQLLPIYSSEDEKKDSIKKNIQNALERIKKKKSQQL